MTTTYETKFGTYSIVKAARGWGYVYEVGFGRFSRYGYETEAKARIEALESLLERHADVKLDELPMSEFEDRGSLDYLAKFYGFKSGTAFVDEHDNLETVADMLKLLKLLSKNPTVVELLDARHTPRHGWEVTFSDQDGKKLKIDHISHRYEPDLEDIQQIAQAHPLWFWERSRPA